MSAATSYEQITVVTKIRRKKPIVPGAHPIQRARQRFGVKGDDAAVRNWIIQRVELSEFASIANSEEYGIGRLFVYKDFAAVLDIKEDAVLTVYPVEVTKEVRTKVRGFFEKELKRIDSLKKRLSRKYTRETLKLKVEHAELEYKLLDTRSVTKANEMRARLLEIEESIANMAEELAILDMERAETAKGYSSFGL